MERLKKTVGLILLVSFSLCFISVPALADRPWDDEEKPRGQPDPPIDQTIAPKGSSSVFSDRSVDGSGFYSYTGILIELSYQMAVFMGYDDIDLKDSAGPSVMRAK